MSVTDILSSICTVLGRIPAPKDAPQYYGIGTTKTCSAQGFVYMSIISTVVYNSALAVYFLLVVRYQWKEVDIKKAERLMHILAIGIWLISGITCLALNLFNPDYFICFIGTLPTNCMTDCERGFNPTAFRWGFFYGPVWVMIIAVTTIMGLVYHTVLTQERRMDRFEFRSSTMTESSGSPAIREAVRRKYSKKVAIQGMWYLVPFYLTWIFPMLIHALSTQNVDINYKILLDIMAFFMPLQGFMNLCVYLRPAYLRRRDKNISNLFSSRRASDNPTSLRPSLLTCALTRLTLLVSGVTQLRRITQEVVCENEVVEDVQIIDSTRSSVIDQNIDPEKFSKSLNQELSTKV